MSDEANKIIGDAKSRMQKSLDDLGHQMAQIRSGRATPSLVEDIRVEVYGQHMPLNQVASIAAPEARLITIDVWDKSQLQAVEKAIQKSGKNINPSNDGILIRINLAEMSGETRKEMVKLAKSKVEDHKVAIRNIRRDANDALKKLKGSSVSEDQIKGFSDTVQKHTDDFIKKMDDLFAAKEKDIMTV
ncbi:MAG: ribosome recycling factor [Spirochaetes bacterium]|nr:ribosome recycling factor [Spirochaetota bacterium]MBX3721682.1 ribosome recycling factor [Turneriella sp.]